MKRKRKLTLSIATLLAFLSGCASPASSPELSSSISPEASPEESLPESSQQESSSNDYYEFYHSETLFEKDYSREDGIYQFTLDRIPNSSRILFFSISFSTRTTSRVSNSSQA